MPKRPDVEPPAILVPAEQLYAIAGQLIESGFVMQPSRLRSVRTVDALRGLPHGLTFIHIVDHFQPVQPELVDAARRIGCVMIEIDTKATRARLAQKVT